MKYLRIEINFPVEVEIPDTVFQKIDQIITDEVCKPYKEQNPTRTMWVFGHGCKCYYSPADVGLLGQSYEMDENIKNGEGPRINNSIYEMTITEREKY